MSWLLPLTYQTNYFHTRVNINVSKQWSSFTFRFTLFSLGIGNLDMKSTTVTVTKTKSITFPVIYHWTYLYPKWEAKHTHILIVKIIRNFIRKQQRTEKYESNKNFYSVDWLTHTPHTNIQSIFIESSRVKIKIDGTFI